MYNRDVVLQTIYDNLAKLNLGDLVLVNAQLADHMNNVIQYMQIQREAQKNAEPSDERGSIPAGPNRSGKIN